MKIPITVNYKRPMEPIDYIELDDLQQKLLLDDLIVIAPSYVVLDDGTIEIQEVSLIPKILRKEIIT